MPLHIYGGSDDLIEVRGDVDEEFDALTLTAGAEHHIVTSAGDHVVFRLRDNAIWTGEVLAAPAGHVLHRSREVVDPLGNHKNDEYGCPGYSDRVALDSDVTWVVYAADPKMATGRPKNRELREFAVTFGSQYNPRQEVHPHWTRADRDGWLTVIAEDEGAARALAMQLIGSRWSNIYPLGEQDASFYPLGELGRIANLDDVKALRARDGGVAP